MTGYLEALQNFFPRAIKGEELTQRVNSALEQRGFTPENTIFADSTCPDELNRKNTEFEVYWGEDFRMGGLGGIPFTGPTGFAACAHHVPDGGNLLILYASHVGINPKGEVGKAMRKNMSHQTSACGSSVGAYNSLRENPEFFTGDKDLDPQQAAMIELIRRNFARIDNSDDPMIELPTVVFEDIHRRIGEIVTFDHGDYQKIALLGGVQINTPNGEPDYFLPLNFQLLNRTGERADLMQELYK